MRRALLLALPLTLAACEGGVWTRLDAICDDSYGDGYRYGEAAGETCDGEGFSGGLGVRSPCEGRLNIQECERTMAACFQEGVDDGFYDAGCEGDPPELYVAH